MINRRRFIERTASLSLLFPFAAKNLFGNDLSTQIQPVESEFSKRLKPVGRILEEEDYFVWGCSPVYDESGKVHVFYSRWLKKYGMGGWIHACEIAHAVADSPESDFKHVETIFSPRPGYFDATTCHNPHIQHVDGKYCLFYIGNTNGKTDTQRIGLATADSLNGPWKRPDKPLLEAGKQGAWDDQCTTNPAFVKNPNGQSWLYYKSFNHEEYEKAAGQRIRGNRKYGLSIANKVTGPYKKYKHNPVVDFSTLGHNEQLEDAYVWIEDGKFKMIARDMGFFNNEYGIIIESNDGIHWGEPKIAWYQASHYINQPAAPHLNHYGRFERPQILMRNGKPEFLFTATRGGKYGTASGFVFKIEKSE